MSAVQARIYYAMKQEFKLLKGIIRDYTPEEYSYDPEVGDRRAKQADYDNVDVIPVSDPNAATMSQKVVQYQAVMQMAQANPQIYDLPELNKQMLEVLGVKNISKLIPSVDTQKPKDPVSENMAIITSKPVKAFIYQDHEAHIQVHLAFKDNPKLAQLVGQSPNAQALMAAMEAHIAEHIAFAYRRQIEEQLGAPLPAPNETLPEDIELEVSRLVAQAAQKLNAKDSAEIQQQQAQQQQQDPLIQMQQQELAIKQQESQAKSQKMLADHNIEQQRVDIEKAKLELEKAKIESSEKIAGAQLGAKSVLENKKIDVDVQRVESDNTFKGMEFGADQVQQHLERQNQKEQKDKQQPKE
jgi:signal transduction histidine kinase